MFHNIHAKQLTMKLPKEANKKHAFFMYYNSHACADHDHVTITGCVNPTESASMSNFYPIRNLSSCVVFRGLLSAYITDVFCQHFLFLNLLVS